MKISLERAILVTLALEFRKDQSRWYTTTEIAHLVNNYFKLIKRNKNNVSRYFNQAFYVYYEVQCVNLILALKTKKKSKCEDARLKCMTSSIPLSLDTAEGKKNISDN